MNVKLDDAITRSEQPQKLPFGSLQRGVRHHIEQPHVQFPDVLTARPLDRQHLLAGLTEALEGGQIGVPDERHQAASS